MIGLFKCNPLSAIFYEDAIVNSETNENTNLADKFIAEIQQKIDKLLQDFDDGKLNKEQFNTVYARYAGQMRMVEEARQMGLNNPEDAGKDNKKTAMLLSERAAKIQGMRIFDARTSMDIDTLGTFEVPTNWLMPFVNNMFMAMEAKQPLGRLIEKVDDKRHVVMMSGKHTVIAAVVNTQPSPRQLQELNQMHRDFEQANRSFFQSQNVNANDLAYPFLMIINQTQQRRP
jgi:hypothetical protein